MLAACRADEFQDISREYQQRWHRLWCLVIFSALVLNSNMNGFVGACLEHWSRSSEQFWRSSQFPSKGWSKIFRSLVLLENHEYKTSSKSDKRQRRQVSQVYCQVYSITCLHLSLQFRRTTSCCHLILHISCSNTLTSWTRRSMLRFQETRIHDIQKGNPRTHDNKIQMILQLGKVLYSTAKWINHNDCSFLLSLGMFLTIRHVG